MSIAVGTFIATPTRPVDDAIEDWLYNKKFISQSSSSAIDSDGTLVVTIVVFAEK